MPGLPFTHRVPTRFMSPLVIAATDDQARLVPDDLATNVKADSKQGGFHLAGVQASVPDICNITRKQRPSLTPIRVIVIEDLAESLSGAADPSLTPPSGIVADAVGRVGDHQVRLDAAEHALDVRGDRAVAAEEAVPSEQPQIARLRHRMLGHRRRVVRVRQPRGPLGHDVFELELAEPGQRQIKPAELQLAQLEAQQLRVSSFAWASLNICRSQTTAPTPSCPTA